MMIVFRHIWQHVNAEQCHALHVTNSIDSCSQLYSRIVTVTKTCLTEGSSIQNHSRKFTFNCWGTLKKSNSWRYQNVVYSRKRSTDTSVTTTVSITTQQQKHTQVAYIYQSIVSLQSTGFIDHCSWFNGFNWHPVLIDRWFQNCQRPDRNTADEEWK